MRFRSELPQPLKDDSQATFTRIYDVYMTRIVVWKAKAATLDALSTKDAFHEAI